MLLYLLPEMEQPDSYFTISSVSHGIFKDRGSKFLAYAYPVRGEEEIKQCLALLRSEHPAARHHCYAWRLGPIKQSVRVNDDGEPSNSAGKPILMQLQAKQLWQVLVVVVRYFGGTLLGVSGLMNAYKNAAANALINAEITECFIMSEYKVSFDSVQLGSVMRLLKDYNAKLLSNSYSQEQEIIFSIKKQAGEQLEGKFKNLYKARLELLKTV